MDNNNEFINSQLDVKLQSFLPRLSIALQNKLLYSIQLLQKAEKLALSCDATGGTFLHLVAAKIVNVYIMLLNLLVLSL